MKLWQYRREVYYSAREIVAAMNEQGADGWEAYSVSELTAKQIVVHYKREVDGEHIKLPDTYVRPEPLRYTP